MTETRPVNMDDIEDGEMVAVIVHDERAPGGFRVAGYCEGKAVPDSVEKAIKGAPVRAVCLCGEVNLVYRSFSHTMPGVHPWPTLTYLCTDCGRTLSFMRLTAADARRALSGGLGTAPPD